jgi:UDP-N-acetylglucosamine 2-epimerase (non-hydrolysing)/GDP/UDP-N,N'-diacetylbacillosamine 2-epimerase (hydrolysing)
MHRSRKKRRIAVLTTSRADSGHLQWIVNDLSRDPRVELDLIAIGAHLSPEFGRTVDAISSRQFRPTTDIECLLSSDSDIGMAKTIGVATLGLADHLGKSRPDLLLLTADRYEMLAAACAALALRIPMAHIEGGEISEGAIDDAVRNAITKMSHIHFACTQKARQRVIAMGEEEWRVHFTGSPSIDQLRRNKLLGLQQLQRKLRFPVPAGTLAVVYHPVTLLQDTTRESAALFTALSSVKSPLIFMYPNADAGSRKLIERAQRFVSEHPDSRLLVNFDHVTYLSLLARVSALIGNSSSGIIEAAALGLPVVNIGLRQKGREHAKNVLDVEASPSAILEATCTATSISFRRSLRRLDNPYGDGHASKTIAHLLATVPLGDRLLFKRSS